MPRKKKVKISRIHAHSNPLADHFFPYPSCPAAQNWETLFPLPPLPENAITTATELQTPPDFLDMGCGFGGLTVALSETYPNKKVLAMEIRPRYNYYTFKR